MDVDEIGPRAKAIRERLGLSQQAVAVAAGISIRAYQSFEAGRADTRASTIASLAGIFGCSADEILGTSTSPQGAEKSTASPPRADEDALFVGRWFFSLSKPARRAAIGAAMAVKRPDLADILERAMAESSRSDGEGGSGSRSRRRAAGGKG